MHIYWRPFTYSVQGGKVYYIFFRLSLPLLHTIMALTNLLNVAKQDSQCMYISELINKSADISIETMDIKAYFSV